MQRTHLSPNRNIHKRAKIYGMMMVLFSLGMIASCRSTPEQATSQPTADPTSSPIPLPTPALSYTIEPIQCAAETSDPHALTLYDEDTNLLSGWSHAADGVKAFANLNLPAAEYKINATDSQPDPNCDNLPTLQVVLVKKYADWDRQHVNGIEPHFGQEKILFRQVESVVIELKINWDKTFIATPEQLADWYGDYLTPAQFSEWDSGKVDLGITLFEEGFNEQSTPSFTGALIIEVDQAAYFDQWIRITIPAESFAYFQEQNYARTPVPFDDFTDHLLLGLRINPETRTGNVVRSYLLDNFDSSIPEEFKEMAVSIKQVKITLKP